MADTKDAQSEMISQWMKMQENVMRGWLESSERAFQMMAPAEAWSKHVPAFAKVWEDWVGSFKFPPPETAEDGLGPAVHSRVTNASRVYQDVLSFWAKTQPLAEALPGAAETPAEAIGQLRENWMKHYQEVMDTLWGGAPSKDVQDTGKALTDASVTTADYFWGFMEPMIENLKDLPKIFQKISRGDTSAVADVSGIFVKNYEDTMGKALLAPTVGYFKEFQDRLNKALYGYLRFKSAREAFFAVLYKTGGQAAEKIYHRSLEHRGKEVTPESLKEFYRTWWTVNEETYGELFRSKEFTDLTREMLRRGLLFRKGLDELSDHILKFTNLPGKKDMDEIYRTLYELKKEVRNLKRELRTLEGKKSSKPRRGKPAR